LNYLLPHGYDIPMAAPRKSRAGNGANVRLAADIGGTFTDIAVFDDKTGRLTFGKALSTPARLVDGISSGVQVAVAFFPPSDFLSLDEFIAANNLQMDPEIYPADLPTSLVGLLIQCPGEGPSEGPPDPSARVSIQDCPDETEKADPASYIDGAEVPLWLLHGLADTQIPFNQSQLVYDATIAEGNEARLSLVPGAGHRVEDIIDADEATTWATNRGGHEKETVGAGPSWDEIEHFIHVTLERAR